MNLEGILDSVLTKWASDPSDLNAQMREDLCASLVGATLVDNAIAKLASLGRITEDEAAYLTQLHTESVRAELGALTKSAGAPEWLGNALTAPLRHPTTTGAVVGAVGGGALGAWKDDENPMRGAAMYALPGAALGAVGGTVMGDLTKEWLHHRAMRDMSGVTEAMALVPDAIELARARLRSNKARRELSAFHAQHSAQRDSARQFSETVAGREAARASQAAAEAAAAERAAAAAAAATAAGVKRDMDVTEAMASRWKDAERWHSSLMDTAQMAMDNHSDSRMKDFAKRYYETLVARKDQVIRQAYDRPGLHAQDILIDHFNEIPLVNDLHRMAALYHRSGG